MQIGWIVIVINVRNITNNGRQMKACQKQLLQNQLNKSSSSVSQSVSQSVSENNSLDSSELVLSAGAELRLCLTFLECSTVNMGPISNAVDLFIIFLSYSNSTVDGHRAAHNWFYIWKNSPLLSSRFFLSQLKSLRVNRNECLSEMLLTINLLCFSTINCQDKNNLIW